MKMHYVPLPFEVDQVFREQKVTRLIGSINDFPVRRGIVGRKDGERYIILGRTLMRDIGVSPGDIVFAELRPDPDPEYIELGEEFEAVLDDDPEAAVRFFGMTTGKRRSLAYYITSAKRVETRIKRALEIAHKLKTYTLYGDKRPE